MAEQQETQAADRARRKIRTGVVTSDKMTKTVTVSLTRRYAHPVYGKQVTRTKKVKARNVEGEEIGRASCRERSVDLGGRRIIKKKRRKPTRSSQPAQTSSK